MRPPKAALPLATVAVRSSSRMLLPAKAMWPLMLSMACGIHMCRSRPPTMVARPPTWSRSRGPVTSATTSARPAPRRSLEKAWITPRLASPSACSVTCRLVRSTSPRTLIRVLSPVNWRDVQRSVFWSSDSRIGPLFFSW